MPKSYISSEPGAQRALKSKFDPYAQVYNRVIALKKTGHNIQKIELIVLDRSWSTFRTGYRGWAALRLSRAWRMGSRRRIAGQPGQAAGRSAVDRKSVGRERV